jgi:hypothetical protein
MSSMTGRSSIALLLGLTGLVTGLGLTLLPLSVPWLPFWLWTFFYWCGSALMILGGFIVDIMLLYVIARRLQGWSRNAVRG